MAKKITGEVDVKRVDELLAVNPAEIREKVLLTDLLANSSSQKVTIPILEAALIHNNLKEVQLAGTGVTYGHINNAAQTIVGVKTFENFSITPSALPTLDYQVANKAYVDQSSSTASDRLKVSIDDTTSGFLYEKIEEGSGIIKAISNPLGNELLNLSIDTEYITVNTNPGGKDWYFGGAGIVSANSGYNVGVGPSALGASTDGFYNTAVGRSAGGGNIVGIKNIFIGAFAGAYEKGSDKLYISSLLSTDQVDEATAKTKVLIYGEQSATTADQILRINSKVGINSGNNVLGTLVLEQYEDTANGGFAIIGNETSEVFRFWTDGTDCLIDGSTDGSADVILNKSGGGQVKVGGYTGGAKFGIKGVNDSASSYSLVVNSEATFSGLLVANNGAVYAPATYNLTTAASPNLVMDSAGLFRRSTSSMQMKENFDEFEALDVFKFQPFYFTERATGLRRIGFGAEQLGAIDEKYIQKTTLYDKNNKPILDKYGKEKFDTSIIGLERDAIAAATVFGVQHVNSEVVKVVDRVDLLEIENTKLKKDIVKLNKAVAKLNKAA